MKAILRTYYGEEIFSEVVVEVDDDYDGDPYGDKVHFCVGSNQTIVVED